jgi:hypothetical protein
VKALQNQTIGGSKARAWINTVRTAFLQSGNVWQGRRKKLSEALWTSLYVAGDSNHRFKPAAKAQEDNDGEQFKPNNDAEPQLPQR